MQSSDRKPRVIIAGAGPAGSSLAIRLARGGSDVTLIERERFPRHKLCGEFISPECLRHFREFGLGDRLLSAGGEKIYETRFYGRRGRSFAIPSGSLEGEGFALSLSRYEMDNALLDGAKTAGVRVLEATRIADLVIDGGVISGVETAGDGDRREHLTADLIVDATGRAAALVKLAGRKLPERGERRSPQRPVAIGFKAHLKGARTAPGVCEIFSFPGGYGGLTMVEGGLANLCFMMDPHRARKIGGDADELVRRAVCANRRAAVCLTDAKRAGDWLAVSVNSFGKRRLPESPANLLPVGDAAAFIDPFTGSGMLMALESAELLAAAIGAAAGDARAAREHYHKAYERAFSRRLRVCSLLRRAAFVPVLPTLVISFLDLSRGARGYLTESTRRSADAELG